MDNTIAVLFGVFLCVGWPAIWVGITVYLMRYRPPLEWRGFFRRRDEEDEV